MGHYAKCADEYPTVGTHQSRRSKENPNYRVYFNVIWLPHIQGDPVWMGKLQGGDCVHYIHTIEKLHNVLKSSGVVLKFEKIIFKNCCIW